MGRIPRELLLSTKETKELIDMYKSGKYYIKEICEYFGIGYAYFNSILYKNGLKKYE